MMMMIMMMMIQNDIKERYDGEVVCHKNKNATEKTHRMMMVMMMMMAMMTMMTMILRWKYDHALGWMIGDPIWTKM